MIGVRTSWNRNFEANEPWMVTNYNFEENSGKDDSKIGEEMNGRKLDDGVARDDKNAKGSLSIIEAEIYSKN